MAVNFVIGDIVTPRLQHDATNIFSRAALGPGVQPMGGLPVGVVNGGTLPSTTVNVAWCANSGGAPSLVTGLVPDALDILTDASSSSITSLLGRFVRVQQTVSEESPELQGTVVALYVRNPGGDTASPTSDLALIKLVDGTFREVQADQLEVVPGR